MDSVFLDMIAAPPNLFLVSLFQLLYTGQVASGAGASFYMKTKQQAHNACG